MKENNKRPVRTTAQPDGYADRTHLHFFYLAGIASLQSDKNDFSKCRWVGVKVVTFIRFSFLININSLHSCKGCKKRQECKLFLWLSLVKSLPLSPKNEADASQNFAITL